MSKLSERKLAWGFGLALAVLATNALISYTDLALLEAHTRDVVHSRRVLERLEAVMLTFKDLESARRGVLIDGNADDFAAFDKAASTFDEELAALVELTADGPEGSQSALPLRRAGLARLEELRGTIDRVKVEGPENVRRGFAVDASRDRARSFASLALAIEKQEEAQQRLRVARWRSGINRAYATFSIASTLALVLIGSIYLIVRRYLAERSKADLTLRESEARVRLLLDSAGEGVYGVDRRGLCTFCNPAALQLLGFESADEVLGRDMHDLIHHTHEDGAPYEVGSCPIYRTFHTGEGTLGEEDIFWRADGSTIPVEYRAHPIRRDGESLGAVVTFVDIAPKRRAETEMRLRDRALKAIAQGVFITDPARSDEPIIYVNAAFERLTGYSQADATGRNIEFLRGPETDPEALGEILAAFNQRREASVEILASRKDGSNFWGALTIAPVDGPDGRVTHFVGVLTDITGRRRDVERLCESEERLRLMIESVRDYAIFSIDLEGRVSSWNGGAERLFGYDEAEVLGRAADLLTTPEDRQAGVVRAELDRAEATGRADDERWYVRRDASRFFASVLVTPVRDDDGTLLGYTKIARDITESKRAEVEVLAAKEAAEVANRAKSSFLTNMSHELRTPLNAIIGYSEMLEEEARDRDLGEFVPDLERIHSSGKHLLGLINDLLDLSKIEAGRMELYLEDFDLAGLVRATLSTIGPLAVRRGNALNLELAEPLGMMLADQTKVHQALLNLLSNAIKFTEGGTVALRAARVPDAEGLDWVVLEVEDDGIGMTPEELGRLFRPFVQADPSTTRKYGGTGLGLTISRRFCEMMGGEIGVRSQSGRGSTFTIRLPADVEAHWVNFPIPSPTTIPDPSPAAPDLKEEAARSWPGFYLSKTTS